MGEVNAAIEVGKQQLLLQLGSKARSSRTPTSRADQAHRQAAWAGRLLAGVDRGWFLPKRADCGFAGGGVAGGNRQSAPGARVR